MAFISTTFASRYLPTNNQLRTLSNLRNQATIQDGRITVQNVQGRETQGYAGNGARGNATCIGVNKNVGTNIANQEKVVCCYNCQGEAHMSRQCTKLKRPKNSKWFKEKMLLAQALEAGDCIGRGQMEFLADDGGRIAIGQDTQALTTATIFQTDYLDAFDSDCDEAPSASAVLMAKLSAYVSDVLSESLTTELERYKEQINIFEERQKFDLTDREKYIDGHMQGVIIDRNAKFDIYPNEIQTLKIQLSADIESNKVLNNQMDVLKKEFSKKQEKYIEEIVDLEKKKKALENIVYKMGQTVQTMHVLTKPQFYYDEAHKTAIGYQNPLYLTQAQRKQFALYCGHTIVRKHDALSIIDTKETLKFAEESKLKMHAKQNDPIAKENKMNIPPIDYAELNKLSEHFVKHFVPKNIFLQNKPFGYQF
ncbi:hypothetical protein Tco_0753976 [Tanacetum coccineum]